MNIKIENNPSSYLIVNGDRLDNKEYFANNFNSFFQNFSPTFYAIILHHINKIIKTFLKENIAFPFDSPY